jgi:Tol biopolymer transport system component
MSMRIRHARWAYVLASVVTALGLLVAPTATSAAGTAPATGGVIIFDDIATGHIYAVNPNGSGFVQLTHDAANVASLMPAWSPDGQRIVFTRRGAKGHEQLFTMARDGTDRHLVRAERAAVNDQEARYFPGGKRLVFVRCPADFSACRLAVMNVDGTHAHFVTPHRHEVYDVDPIVSPDGRRIAFSRVGAGGVVAQVWIMHADGTHAHPVTATKYEAYGPDFAPGGRRMLFSSNCCRLSGNVFVMNLRTSNVHRITHTAYPLATGSAVFSPNASRIAITSNRRYPDRCCGDLYVKPVGAGRAHRVPLPVNHPNYLDWRPATSG